MCDVHDVQEALVTMVAKIYMGLRVSRCILVANVKNKFHQRTQTASIHLTPVYNISNVQLSTS